MQDIERDSKRYAAKGPEWDWSFRILRAHVYIYRREYKKTLEALSEPLPASLETTPIAVRKNIYEGEVYRLAQEFEKSEKRFNAASSLAERYQPRLEPEVFNSQAVLLTNEKKYPEADAGFRRALILSRQNNDQNQELKSMVSLAALEILMEHFDEALEMNQEALKLANAMGRAETGKLIVGNMGSSYFALGDFENAIPLFTQAAQSAGDKKLYDSQAHWMMDVAECYYEQHEYEQAERILTQVLAVARQLDEKTALTECLNDLAEVALETGRLDAAEKYNNEERGIEQAGLDRSAKLESQLIRGRIAAGHRDYAGAKGMLQGIVTAEAAPSELKWEAQARLAKTLDEEERPPRRKNSIRRRYGRSA